MSKAIAEWRKARSVELVLQGYSYDQVAAEVGYANRGTAWRTVTKALGERTELAARELRELETARLDYLQSKLVDGIEAGDVKAINAATRIVMARARLHGLDRISEPVEPMQGRIIVDPAELARRGERQRQLDEAATRSWMEDVGDPGMGEWANDLAS